MQTFLRRPLPWRDAGRALLALAAFAAAPLACAPDDASAPTAAADDDIVGGTVATGRPYVVMVGDGQRAGCSGTLISKRTVLTAAHCEPINITTVEFGARQGDPSNVRRRVTRAVKHPGFRNGGGGPGGVGMTNDMLVLQLDADAPVAPAPVLREALTNSPTFVGPAWNFVGFGRTGGGQQDYGTKRQVSLPVAAVGPATAPDGRQVGSTQVYYRTPGRSACQGDSGGPSFVVRGGVEVQAGVTSFGHPTCGDWGVQQKVDQGVLEAFLQGVIDEFEGRDACRSDGVCTESCNTGGQVRDPDCAAAHCGADGLCSPACVSPVDPDCSGSPPPPPPPPANLACPAGFSYEAASRLCVNATEAVGPFPPAMVEKCRQFGGGDGCAEDTWAVQFARDLRGASACPPGTSLDARKGYCAEGENLYGPFTKAEVDACIANGGGPSCTTTVRWHRSFIADKP